MNACYLWSFMFFHLSSWYVIRDSQIWWPHKLNEWWIIMTHQNTFPLTMKLNFAAKTVPQLQLKKMKHAAEMHYHCQWQNGTHVKTLQVFRGQGLMQNAKHANLLLLNRDLILVNWQGIYLFLAHWGSRSITRVQCSKSIIICHRREGLPSACAHSKYTQQLNHRPSFVLNISRCISNFQEITKPYIWKYTS